MVTPRKPGENDAEYIARVGDVGRRWEIVSADADRAFGHLTLAGLVGLDGGFDAEGVKGWKRRTAFVRGMEIAREIADSAISQAVSLTGHDVTRVPIGLRDHLMVLRVFAFRHRDTMIPIPQAEIDAVAAAADVVAQQLRPTIETLRKLSQGN